MGIFATLFEGMPVRFDSTLTVEKARSELTLLIHWGPSRVGIKGDVSAEQVTFDMWGGARRGQTYVGFEGRIEPTADGIALIGRYIEKKVRRAICAVGVACAGFTFIGILLGNLEQMVIAYRGMPALLERVETMLIGLTATVAVACLFAWQGGPLKEDIERLSKSIRTALRDDR